MTDKQIKWIRDLTGQQAGIDKLQAREDLKLAVLTQVFSDREAKAGTIADGSRQMAIKAGTNLTQNIHDDRGGDATGLFDLDEQKQGFVLAEYVIKKFRGIQAKPEDWNPENGQPNFERLQEVERVVLDLAARLETPVHELDEHGHEVEETTADGGKRTKKAPLFSAEELKEELYTPLVRRGLMPETFVPDQFSATKEMLDGSFEAYQKRLVKGRKKHPWISEYKNLGFAGVRAAVSFAGTGVGLAADFKATASQLQWTPQVSQGFHGLKENFGISPLDPGSGEERADAVDETAQAMVFVQNASDFVFDVGIDGSEEGYEKVKGKLSNRRNRKARTEAQKNAGKVAGLAVGEIAAAVSEALGANLGIAGASAFGALAPGPAIADLIDKQDIEEAEKHLWAAFSDALTSLAADDAGGVVKGALENARKVFKAKSQAEGVKANLKAGKFTIAASALADAGVSAAKVFKDDAAVQLFFGDANNADKAKTAAGKVAERVLEAPKPDQDTIRAHKPKPEHDPEWLQTSEGWTCLKCADGEADPEMFEGILEAKIAQIEADNFIWNWVTALGGMSLDIAADFVQPFAVSGALLRMVKHAHLAMNRLRDFYNFVEKREAMLQASSAFSAPLAKFVTNARTQFVHYSFNLAAEGLKVVAGVLQMAQITAPAGVGATAAANLAEAAENVLYQANKVVDLEIAWSVYKKALENPNNRKLGLVAMKKNATLAKYAVAWGAVVKKDPLVADFMRNCGLEGDVFKDPGANVDRVVEYLEKRMPDDNVMVGRGVFATRLTVAAWHKEKARLEGKGFLIVKTPTLDRDLEKWETDYSKLNAAPDPKAAREQLSKLLNDLDSHFFRYGQDQVAEAKKKPDADRDDGLKALQGKLDAGKITQREFNEARDAIDKKRADEGEAAQARLEAVRSAVDTFQGQIKIHLTELAKA